MSRSERSRQLMAIEIDKIKPDPENDRGTMDPDQLAELAASMADVGQIAPIIVHRTGASWRLVSGHRRCAAAEMLNWHYITAMADENREEMIEQIRAHENLQREQLSLADEARMVHRFRESRGMSPHQVAESLGRSPGWVKQRLDYLALPERARAQGSAARIV